MWLKLILFESLTEKKNLFRERKERNKERITPSEGGRSIQSNPTDWAVYYVHTEGTGDVWGRKVEVLPVVGFLTTADLEIRIGHCWNRTPHCCPSLKALIRWILDNNIYISCPSIRLNWNPICIAPDSLRRLLPYFPKTFSSWFEWR